MAAVCAVCGKKPVTGNRVSHANNRSRRRWMPNLQPARVRDDQGRVRRVRVCTQCLTGGRVAKV